VEVIPQRMLSEPLRKLPIHDRLAVWWERLGTRSRRLMRNGFAAGRQKSQTEAETHQQDQARRDEGQDLTTAPSRRRQLQKGIRSGPGRGRCALQPVLQSVGQGCRARKTLFRHFLQAAKTYCFQISWYLRIALTQGDRRTLSDLDHDVDGVFARERRL